MGIGLLQTHIYPTARKITRAQRGLGVWGLAPIKCNRKASFHTPFSITAPSFSRFASQDTPTARDRELDINFRKKQLL